MNVHFAWLAIVALHCNMLGPAEPLSTGDIAVTTGTPKAYQFEDLNVGMEASVEKAVTEQDIVSFADVTGDRNPVHLDAEYAAGTIFKERIAHGMLTASYLSAVFGMELPGPGAIYISQNLNFRRPVKIGDAITATVSITELLPEKNRVRFLCVCKNGAGKPVIEGEAVMMVPSRAG